MNGLISEIEKLTTGLTGSFVAIDHVLSGKDVLPTDIIEERRLLEDDALHLLRSLAARAQILHRRINKRLKVPKTA